ncbi:MAG TPA: hypothetical protein PLV72_04035 [Candidatus Magasanikbacteria bacterium]|nr:hypothetical protein [Candidatus Magasanikbacteria bacterium]
MYLERKKLLFLVGGVAILLIILGIVLYFFRVYKHNVTPAGSNAVVSPTEEINSNQPAPVTPGIVKPSAPIIVTKGEPTDVYFKQLTQMFVERYGSYSNQNGNSHISDVLPLVTRSMAKWLTAQDIEQKAEYSGVTTRVVAMRITDKTATKVTVAFDAQMAVSDGSGSRNENRSGRVNLEKVGEDWKVAGYYLDK